MPKLEIRNVSKTFNQKGSDPLRAVDDVSLAVEEGEFIAIVGPSGCGKTTLLRIVQGLETYDSGAILVDGTPITGAGHDRGFVFQQYGLLPWMTAADNISFALQTKGVPRKDHRGVIERVLQTVGLEGFEDRYPRQLSGGMQQRVGIARALAIDPDILLMDEPFGALDALTREILQNEMLSLSEEMNKTVLFVTHSVDEAVFLADRVIVMSRRPGRIKEVLTIDVERPRATRGEEIKETREFAKKRRRLWDLLMEVEKS